MYRFLFDENVVRELKVALNHGWPDVVVRAVGEPGCPPRGTLDPAILVWCEEQDFVRVTTNRKSMPGHLEDHLAAGRHVPGIFILRLETGLGELAAELAFIAGAGLPGEYMDQLSHIPEQGPPREPTE